MATAANLLASLGVDEWEVRVYSALSTASSLAAAIKNRTNAVHLAYSFYKINKSLTEMISQAYEMVEGKRTPPPDDEPITPQRLHLVSYNLDELARMIVHLYERGKSAGLTNNSLMAGSLNGMLKHVEEIKDVADWFEAAADSERLSAISARAKQEKENGDLFDLSQVD